MSAAKSITLPERLRVVFTLARLLQTLEAGDLRADAGQYRQVAQRLEAALADTPRDEALEAILGAFPASAEVYENLHYAQAGLVRHDLDAALRAEQRAREFLQRLRG